MNELYSQIIECLKSALASSWSSASSSKWYSDNPSKGQCGVTALVVNDFLGGEIFKTRLSEGWHFYNMIEHKRYDITMSQFRESILYEDIASNRREALMDCNEKQYMYLKKKVLENYRNY
ncbi:hypothetical protein ACIQ4I_00645 [Rummeliibacillus sp. NPDC094406]|uniref:YunG family protein n=1 Tax=Rummeliibacillus sp. NPDC094406 TaxID=3364511 RepID=UPI0038223CAE